MIQAHAWLNMRVKTGGSRVNARRGACSGRMENHKAVIRLIASRRAPIGVTLAGHGHPSRRSKGS
jgi:hypothetical protein